MIKQVKSILQTPQKISFFKIWPRKMLIQQDLNKRAKVIFNSWWIVVQYTPNGQYGWWKEKRESKILDLLKLSHF